jgi:hypothetical protein
VLRLEEDEGKIRFPKVAKWDGLAAQRMSGVAVNGVWIVIGSLGTATSGVRHNRNWFLDSQLISLTRRSFVHGEI